MFIGVALDVGVAREDRERGEGEGPVNEEAAEGMPMPPGAHRPSSPAAEWSLPEDTMRLRSTCERFVCLGLPTPLLPLRRIGPSEFRLSSPTKVS